MIAALERLHQARDNQLPGQLTAFGVHGSNRSLTRLFMSHPPLEERIKALQQG